MLIDAQLPALAASLRRLPAFRELDDGALIPLPTTGLAHDHVRIGNSGKLLRVPRQSQMRLDAVRNLAYQRTCFMRAWPGGHSPRLFGTLAPMPDAPMGALIVEEITGHTLILPGGLPAAARALAAIHGLPVPGKSDRAPLLHPEDPLRATLEEVREQARFLDHADLQEETRRMIERELADAARYAQTAPPPPVTLVAFDAHPGNFLLEGGGRAVLVDLEKMRYGTAGLDLAHATLYTSTTWDIACYGEPDHAAIAGFYDAWLAALPVDLARRQRPTLIPLRRLMWLWSITWCAKWRVESRRTQLQEKHEVSDAEDWSAENSDTDLIAHVRGRVEHYLQPETVARVCADWRTDNALSRALA